VSDLWARQPQPALTYGPCSFTSADVQPFAESILMALFRNIQSGATPEKLAENDYLMKCASLALAPCGPLSRLMAACAQV